MRTISTVKLLTVFAIAFSLASLTGPMSGNFHLPTLQLAHANTQLCETHTAPPANACDERWLPAGPQMSTLQATIFTDETAEFNDIQSATPSIDLTDWQLPNSLLGTFTSSSNFLITAQQASVGYYEIEFHLGNTFLGCNFNFGNAPCGVQIRQGIAHMVDKTAFTANQVTIKGHSSPIDVPFATSTGGGLLTPNPCGFDASFPQTGSQCVVGAPGGTSYHLATATGANSIPWLAGPGSADLNAAAQHFVNAGLATGFNAATSILINPIAAPSTPPNFFVRSDNVPRLDLGNSIGEEFCYLFTGSYAFGCPYLSVVRGPITAFPGFTTSPNSVNLNWWMYTAAFSGPTFFDGSLYFGYNSKFASASCVSPGTATCTTQVVGGGNCSNLSVGTSSAGDYEYACEPTYDNLSTQMETAPCGVDAPAPGDPVAGATSNLPTAPGNGICTGTTQLSAHAAGIQALVEYGSHVLTLPMFQTTNQYGYLNNGWAHVQNNSVFGLASFFTWLNGWNNAPHTPGTIRQGFKETTKSISPFISSTIWDAYIDNVYDSLFAADPAAPSTLFDYMVTLTTQLTNSQVISTRGYTPPTGTLLTYEFTLHNDMFFQDQQPVTAFDVAFSYLNLVGSGAFAGTGAAPMTGITIIGDRQFDIGVNSLGPFTLPNLTGLSVMPGRYWTGATAPVWDSASLSAQNTYNTCGTSCPISQYTLTGKTVNCALTCTPFTAALLQVDPAKVTATYDPIASGTFIGSGSWQCGTGQLTTGGSKSCTNTGAQNPPPGGSYTMTAFGAGVAPGACQQSTCYFRSSANLALYLWSEQNSVSPNPIVSIVAFCVGQPPVPLSATTLTGSCAHFQQGIGTNGATTTTGSFSVSCVPTTPPSPEAISVCGTQTTGSVSWTCSTAAPCGFTVGVNQFSVQVRYYGVNWMQPFAWSLDNPTGIGSVTPILYAPGPTTSGTTLNPASSAGCASAYPTGGYDC